MYATWFDEMMTDVAQTKSNYQRPAMEVASAGDA